MMLILSKTGLGSWAHMNLHRARAGRETSRLSCHRQRSENGACCIPSSLPLASFPEAKNLKRFSIALVSGVASKLHILLAGNPTSRLKLTYISISCTSASPTELRVQIPSCCRVSKTA